MIFSIQNCHSLFLSIAQSMSYSSKTMTLQVYNKWIDLPQRIQNSKMPCQTLTSQGVSFFNEPIVDLSKDLWTNIISLIRTLLHMQRAKCPSGYQLLPHHHTLSSVYLIPKTNSCLSWGQKPTTVSFMGWILQMRGKGGGVLHKNQKVRVLPVCH